MRLPIHRSVLPDRDSSTMITTDTSFAYAQENGIMARQQLATGNEKDRDLTRLAEEKK